MVSVDIIKSLGIGKLTTIIRQWILILNSLKGPKNPQEWFPSVTTVKQLSTGETSQAPLFSTTWKEGARGRERVMRM